MLHIEVDDDGLVHFRGRFDASQVESAKKVFDSITNTTTLDFQELDYISSAGLAVLLGVLKRLKSTGNTITVINMQKHIRELFTIAGFDFLFDIR